MAEHQSLQNQFLIAMPAMQDPHFHKTVSYICEHNEQGAIAIIINRPFDFYLNDVLEELEITVTSRRNYPVYYGGPVHQERGFVLHSPEGEWRSTLKLADNLHVTTSRDILEAIAQDNGPEQVLVALGYAGWGAEQLETEIAQNAWLNAPVSTDIIFNTPANQQWQKAAALLGIDINAISGDAGHA